MNYNSFLKEHKDVTMSGTKRYADKSGEYYLKNSVKFRRNNINYLNQKSLTKPYLTNNNNKHIIKVNKNKLYDELVPIPKMKQKNKLKCDYDKKNLKNAENNAKYIRRYQYSKNLAQKQMIKHKEMEINQKIFLSKVKHLQIWWKTIFQIIKIQKFIRGYLCRNKLVKIMGLQEKYIEKVLNLVKVIKKFFWKNYLLLKLMKIKPGIIYYLNKWKEVTFKRLIIKEIIKYLNSEEFNGNEYNYEINNQNLTSRSYNEIKKEKDKNNNDSIIYLYKHSSHIHNRNSSQPFLLIKNSNLINNKNRLSLGLETSFSSRIINPLTEKNINTGLYLNNNKNKLNLTKDKKNQEKIIINKTKKLKVNKYYETKKYNSKKNNNINIDNFKNKKSSSKLHLLNKQNEIKIKTKKNKNKDLIKNKTSTKPNNFTNYNTHNGSNKLKNNKSKKKGKVYENELYLYDNYQTLETNKDNYFLSTNQDLQEFSEGKLNESQFNALLDNNSTFKEDQIIDTCSYSENKNKNIIEMKYNHEFNKSDIDLKDYFQKWTKIFIMRKLINKLLIKKKMILGLDKLIIIYKKMIYKTFFGKIKLACIVICKEKIFKMLDKFRKKIFRKNLILCCQKYCLFKNFNIYKNKIYNRMILEKIKEYLKDKRKKNEEEQNINKEIPNYNLLKEQILSNIPINNDIFKNKLNLNDIKANSCFIINNLNYNNNTNNIDIKLSCDNSDLRNINSKLIELTKKNTKQNKPYIGLYKKSNSPLFYNINNEFIQPNHNLNLITHSNLFPNQKQNNNNSYNLNNLDNTNIYSNKVNLNKSLVLSKYSNQLNWDLITKKNQLIMIINIIERHRKSKEAKLFNKFFEIWKNQLNLKNNENNIRCNPINTYENKDIIIRLNSNKNVKKRNKDTIMNEDVYDRNTFEKKINISKRIENKEGENFFKRNRIHNENKNFDIKNLKITLISPELNKDPNNYFASSVPDLSYIKNDNINKNTVYKKKAITGSSNFIKKNDITDVKSTNISVNEFNIYNKKYGYMSPDNYYYGNKIVNKIEEMEISFGNPNKNKNQTYQIDINKNPIKDNIKYIESDEVNINNMIEEDIEENNEFKGNKENLLLKLKFYFEENKEKYLNYSINQIMDNSLYDEELNEKYGMKKFKSENYLILL